EKVGGTSPPPKKKITQKLSICSKLCFAIGGAPKEVASSATAFFLQIYLLDVAQISAFQASVVLFTGKVWGAVTDPIIGFFMTKSKWTKIGRLMPWMVGCTPFLVVSYFYLWFVPPFITGRFIWYLGFYCLYQTLITCFHVPYSALTMFLSTDQKERDSATAYRKIRHHSCLCGPVVMQDRGQRSYSEALPHSQHVCWLPWKQQWGGRDSEEPGALAGLPVTCCKCLGLTQTNLVLFCTYAADLRDHFQNIVLTILVSAVISIPLWQWFLQRFGKKTAAFCGITWMMPFTMMLVFIPNLVVAYFVAVSSGLSVAASLLLPWSMLPDVVDDFRLTNPFCKGHEAIFYSFYVFFTKFAAGVSLGVSTLCLQFAGYNNGACRQPAPVVYTLKLLIGVAPVAFIVTGLLILLLYPINEDVRLRNRVQLEELRCVELINGHLRGKV
uniref:MFSD2 lysolipid transporter B, sphingolipid n=1 Tax=Nothobranchius furzeri TaxID=105023 RepID=A0A8C6KQD1_NOTFU